MPTSAKRRDPKLTDRERSQGSRLSRRPAPSSKATRTRVAVMLGNHGDEPEQRLGLASVDDFRSSIGSASSAAQITTGELPRTSTLLLATTQFRRP
jgi:hypothetical protein